MPDGMHLEEQEPGAQPGDELCIVPQGGRHPNRVPRHGTESGDGVYASCELLLEDGPGRPAGSTENPIVKRLRDSFEAARVFFVGPSDPTGALIEVPICPVPRTRSEGPTTRTLGHTTSRRQRPVGPRSGFMDAGMRFGAPTVGGSASQQWAASIRRIPNLLPRWRLREADPRSF